MKLMLGDCLECVMDIPDGSVDLVLTDPPYGTMKNAGNGAGKKYESIKCEWDEQIEPLALLSACSRLLRPNGKALLFSIQPYTSELVCKCPPSMQFCYTAVWVKNNAGHGLNANRSMVSRFEDVCIFSKPTPKHDFDGKNPLRAYFKAVLDYIGARSAKDVNKRLGHRRAEHCFYVTGAGNGSTQFSLCTEQTYQELIDAFGIDEMDGFRDYHDLKKAQDEFNDGYNQNGYKPSTFNLLQGGKSKSNVLEYPKDRDHYHPTQKPIALLEDLIQTFSNPGDTVLDFTMGSGSTGVACVNTGRDFIGIELDDGYFEIAKRRIEEAQREHDAKLF